VPMGTRMLSNARASALLLLAWVAVGLGCGGQLESDPSDRSTNPGEVAGDLGSGGARRAGFGGNNFRPADGSPGNGGGGWPDGAAGTAGLSGGSSTGFSGALSGGAGSLAGSSGSAAFGDGAARDSGAGGNGGVFDDSGACASSQLRCGGSCIDPASNPMHCGACGVACNTANGERCFDSQCSLPSCSAAAATECNGESCCATLSVPGGAFMMGRGETGTDACPSGTTCQAYETPEHLARVSPFVLDKYEVTVSRFRSFVQAYPASRPLLGAGAHPNIPNSGWKSAWDDRLPPNQRELTKSLTCDMPTNTWSEEPASGTEDYAINCATWYEAFAFCIWDGGRLPTEAEWEYAAAGGDENRLYPWGSAEPSSSRANRKGGGYTTKRPVGSTQNGNGRWGHADLAGNMWEWTLDGFATDWYFVLEGGVSGNPCNDCANLADVHRTVRGGGHNDASDSYLRAAMRGSDPTDDRSGSLGWRCARGN
jgi:formylglycine-generating enzyme